MVSLLAANADQHEQVRLPTDAWHRAQHSDASLRDEEGVEDATAGVIYFAILSHTCHHLPGSAPGGQNRRARCPGP